MIVTEVVVVLLQVPLVKLYVTVYVPAVLVNRLITPVVVLMLNPAVEL